MSRINYSWSWFLETLYFFSDCILKFRRITNINWKMLARNNLIFIFQNFQYHPALIFDKIHLLFSLHVQEHVRKGTSVDKLPKPIMSISVTFPPLCPPVMVSSWSDFQKVLYLYFNNAHKQIREEKKKVKCNKDDMLLYYFL